MTMCDLICGYHLKGCDGVSRNLLEICYHQAWIEWDAIERLMPLLVVFSAIADKEWYI